MNERLGYSKIQRITRTFNTKNKIRSHRFSLYTVYKKDIHLKIEKR